MYDINIKNVKKGRAFNWIFIGFGLLFLVIMFIIFFGSILNRNTLDSETTSTDVNPNRHQDSDGDYVYSPIFTYEVDGQTYTCTSGVSSSIGPGEDPHVIHYDSKNPSNCMSDYAEKIDWFILLFALIPTVFIVIGACMNHSISKRIKQIEALNQTGKLVKNLPFHLEESNISVNDRPLMKKIIQKIISLILTLTAFLATAATIIIPAPTSSLHQIQNRLPTPKKIKHRPLRQLKTLLSQPSHQLLKSNSFSLNLQWLFYHS